MEDPAVFAIESNGAYWFKDVQRAASWMEAEDVEDGVYRVFNRDGGEYRLEVMRNRVVVSSRPEGTAPEYLAERLRAYLLHVAPRLRRLTDGQVANATLAELIDEFRAVERPQ
ncbi:MAG: hypothetical protein M3256_10615 [Actinomycetota bacterium]|nr:hypothetical protein [Actinomycetota bacterium]